MQQYEVTIGIPVYEVKPYIENTLLSALSQTFGSIEFLLVDDCGNDGTMDVVKTLQSSHPRGKDIRILHQPHNMGVSAARNRIIDEARGTYLYFMDADDVITEDCISVLHSRITSDDYEIAYGSYDKISLNGDLVERRQYPDTSFIGEHQLAFYIYSKFANLRATVWNALMRVDFLRATGLKMIKSQFLEDFVFSFDLVTHVSRAVLVSNITYQYMCRENSLSNYQARKNISKQEIINNIRTIDHLKHTSLSMRDKPYMGRRLNCIFKMDYFIVKNIKKRGHSVVPPFSSRELRHVMRVPFSLFDILRFRGHRFQNVLLYLMGFFGF